MTEIPTRGKILIIDDDDNITELLKVNLRSEGYTVEILRSAVGVREEILETTSLVIVDVMSHNFTGIDFIKFLKSNPETAHIGIILYSPYRNESLVIDALNFGADDFLIKPFSLRELIARVKSVLRRYTHSEKQIAPKELKFQNITIDLTNKVAKVDDNPLSLSKTEYSILVLLIQNANSYVSRALIYQIVWKDASKEINERTIDTNISRLRKKLGLSGGRIISRSGLGYMLVND